MAAGGARRRSPILPCSLNGGMGMGMGIPRERGRLARNSRACGRRALILAFFHKWLIGVGLRPWERGRLARRAALGRGAPSS